MSNTTGSITLQQGVGKNSGKPYTALKLKAGKWSQLHFPTSFELEYLADYLKDNQGTFTLDESIEKLILKAGEYSETYTVDSKFEYGYLVNYFRPAEKETTTPSTDDNAKLDLDHEDELKENPFN